MVPKETPFRFGLYRERPCAKLNVSASPPVTKESPINYMEGKMRNADERKGEKCTSVLKRRKLLAIRFICQARIKGNSCMQASHDGITDSHQDIKVILSKIPDIPWLVLTRCHGWTLVHFASHVDSYVTISRPC